MQVKYDFGFTYVETMATTGNHRGIKADKHYGIVYATGPRLILGIP